MNYEPFKTRPGRIGKHECGGELVIYELQNDYVISVECTRCFKVINLEEG